MCPVIVIYLLFNIIITAEGVVVGEGGSTGPSLTVQVQLFLLIGDHMMCHHLND